MPHTLDPAAVRHWCSRALEALRHGREEIDTINVFPVADGDTGSNLCLTVAAADRALREAGECDTLAEAMRTAAHGALLGACGNSGTILAQLMRGMAEVYAAAPPAAAPSDPAPHDPAGLAAPDTAPNGAELLRRGLRRAADAAYRAVARPVEGTMLSVARAAADAAAATPGNDAAAVARAARDGARTALHATTGQLAVLARAGVVDAGGRGLLTVLDALADTLGGETPPPPSDAHAPQPGTATDAPTPPPPGPGAEADPARTVQAPAYEVMYLLDADEDAVQRLRERLDALGDSLVVIGGEGLWNVHVHVDDAGAAVEAGMAAGRPHRLRITHLGSATDRRPAVSAPSHPGPHAPEASRNSGAPHAPPRPRAVVAVIRGEGLAGLCEEAGACVVRAPAGGGADEDTLTATVRDCGAREIVLLPNDPELHATAVHAAERARAAGVRVAVIPTRAAVQGIAALAVHDPGLRFDEDVVAMTSAAGATRYGEVTVAAREAWTTAGVCQAGDVLGLVEGDVAVIGDDIARTASDVLERMLAAGGEMVTLVVGPHAPDGLAARLEGQVRRGHLGVDTVVYEGREGAGPLLVGVE